MILRRKSAVGSNDIEQAVFENEHWFGEDGVIWPYLPTPSQADQKRRDTIELLLRARRPRKYPVTVEEWRDRSDQHIEMAYELDGCKRGTRCGTLSCLVCRRAFARAQYEAFDQAAEKLLDGQRKRRLFAATLVPNRIAFAENQLDGLDVHSLQAVFHREMARTLPNTPFFGVLEISYEEPERGTAYYQPHWHIVLLARSKERLQQQLQQLFWSAGQQRPQDVKEIYNLTGALTYRCKVIEKGYRWSKEDSRKPMRRTIPDVHKREILRWLHAYNPVDFIVAHHLEPTATKGGFRLRACRPLIVPPLKTKPRSVTGFHEVYDPRGDWLRCHRTAAHAADWTGCYKASSRF